MVTDWRSRRWRLWFLALSDTPRFINMLLWGIDLSVRKCWRVCCGVVSAKPAAPLVGGRGARDGGVRRGGRGGGRHDAPLVDAVGRPGRQLGRAAGALGGPPRQRQVVCSRGCAGPQSFYNARSATHKRQTSKPLTPYPPVSISANNHNRQSRVAVISAKNHKRQRRNRQSVTAKRKSRKRRSS